MFKIIVLPDFYILVAAVYKDYFLNYLHVFFNGMRIVGKSREQLICADSIFFFALSSLSAFPFASTSAWVVPQCRRVYTIHSLCSNEIYSLLTFFCLWRHFAALLTLNGTFPFAWHCRRIIIDKFYVLLEYFFCNTACWRCVACE